MGREKHEASATRMVVEIDGRWDPKTLFTRIQSAGLPIQGVKLWDHGRCTLSFGSQLTHEALSMIQQEIVPFFARSPSQREGLPSEKQILQEPKRKRIIKVPYIYRRK